MAICTAAETKYEPGAGTPALVMTGVNIAPNATGVVLVAVTPTDAPEGPGLPCGPVAPEGPAGPAGP